MRVGLNAWPLAAGPGYRQTGVRRYVAQLAAALPDALGSDGELRLLGLPERLARGGHDLREEPEPDLGAALDERRRPGRAWRAPAERPTARAAWEQAALPVLARRASVDILHGPVNVVPLLAPCPTVVTIHDLAFLRRPELVPAGRRRYFAALARASVRRASRVIAVSESTKRDAVELLHARPERVAVTPLAVDAAFRPVTGEALVAFQAEQGLIRPFVLCVGTVEPRKNLDGVLRAFGVLAPEVPHDLVLVGAEGWLTGAVHATWLALPAAIRDRVRFAGFGRAEDLPAWYSAADALAFPSHYEGFGLPVLEAMACGTPVVTSTVSSLPEVAGDAALLVDPADDGALVAALRRVLTDPRLAADLRARGLARARDFSWAATAAATVAVYREAVG